MPTDGIHDKLEYDLLNAVWNRKINPPRFSKDATADRNAAQVNHPSLSEKQKNLTIDLTE